MITSLSNHILDSLVQDGIFKSYRYSSVYASHIRGGSKEEVEITFHNGTILTIKLQGVREDEVEMDFERHQGQAN